MSQLQIKDLSLNEDLDRRAMAAIIGGTGQPPCGKAWGYYKNRKQCHQPPGGGCQTMTSVSTAQAGVGIFNFTNVDFEGGSISIITKGAVTATASA